MTSTLAEMQAFVDGCTQQQLCAWLLRGLTSGTFSPLEFGDERALSEHLRILFAVAKDGQEKFKRALEQAVTEWTCHAHGPAVLTELANLVAETRTSGALRPLQLIVEAGQVRSASPDEDVVAIETVFAVIGGFSERDEAAIFLERYFFDPTQIQLRALLFTALCERAPREYYRYMPLLLEAIDAQPKAFITRVIFRNFVGIVSFYIIAHEIARLPADYRARMLDFLRPIFKQMEAELDKTTQGIVREHLRIASEPPADLVEGEFQEIDGVPEFIIPFRGSAAEIDRLVLRQGREYQSATELHSYVLSAA